MKRIARCVIGVLLLAAPVLAQNGDENGAASTSGNGMNMEILLQKIKADKKLLVASNLNLSEAEGRKFWPLYEAYQKELGTLNRRLGQTIKSYADAFDAGNGTISNELAKKLLAESLAIEDAESKMKRAYADKIGTALSPTKTARYIQIENKIRAAIKAELAQNIPLIY